MPVGVHMCVPFEEGILHSWMGGVGCPPIGVGLKVGSNGWFSSTECSHHRQLQPIVQIVCGNESSVFGKT